MARSRAPGGLATLRQVSGRISSQAILFGREAVWPDSRLWLSQAENQLMSSRIISAPIAALVVISCGGDVEEAPAVRQPGVTVRSFEPKGETATRPIEVWFDQPVVETKQVGRKNAGPAPLSLTPDVPGHHEWRAVDHLVFVPSEPFSASTHYEALVRQDALSLPLLGEARFRFNTELFTLKAIEPFFGGSGDVRVNVVFTHVVTARAAADTIGFETTTGRKLGARLETSKTGRVMAFQLQQQPTAEEGDEIRVRVGGQLAAAAGGDPIGKDIVRTITVEADKALKVHDISPSEQSGTFTLWVRFSAPVDPAVAAKAITISPKVEVRTVSGYWGVGLTGPFAPSTTYEVTVAQGLRAQNGSTLDHAVVRSVPFPDLEPSVRFEDTGTYLMRRGRQTFSVNTVNVQRLLVTVDAVADNNLAHIVPRLAAMPGCRGDDCGREAGHAESLDYYWRTDLGTLGRRVFKGSADVNFSRNEANTTHVPFADVDDAERQGVYRVRIADKERTWIYAEKWMLATDLGLTVKVAQGEVRAHVVSLSTLQPVDDVTVHFISRTNDRIGSAVTSQSGFAVLRYAPRPEDPLSLVTARRRGDFAYLALAGTAIPTADFDVGGADAAGPYDAYLFSDRGVYRPGDRLRLGVIVRERSMRTPSMFPYNLEIRDPRWRVFRTVRASTDEDGTRAFDIDIPEDAPTGTYVIRALAAGQSASMGRLKVRVEAFMPDRLRVDVTAKSKVATLGEAVAFDVSSAYLFGPPAAGLRVESQCRYRQASITSVQHRSFPLAVDPEGASSPGLSVVQEAGTGLLDEQGSGTAQCALEVAIPPRRPVQVELHAAVSEAGGRAVTGSGSAILHAHPHYVGVRRNGETEYAEATKDAGLEILVVDRDGLTKSGVKVTATVKRVEWKSILKLVNGRYRYVSDRTTSNAGAIEAVSAGAPTPLPFVADSPGRYEVDVVTEGGAGSSVSFWVSGSGWNAWEMNKPDQVGLTLDKASYAVGETATLMVRAPFEGKVFLSVERDRVVWTRAFDLSGNTGSFALPVTEDMLPNGYVVAQVVRSAKSVEKAAPLRAFGVIPLKVTAERHRLDVKIRTESKIRPNTTLDALLQVEGARGRARVIVAAVDEGILRITSHPSPDPLAHFTTKRRLGVRTHDLFDQILPEVKGRASSIVRTSGGDAAVRAKHLAAVGVKRVVPVALWSGVIETGADGWARAKLDVPQFAGQLRLMVVAVEGDRFGAASKSITVRDPIVLMPTLPRFVGPLDSFEVPVEVTNGTGAAASISVTVDADGELSLNSASTQTLELGAGARGVAKFSLKANEVAGIAKVVITAAGGGQSVRSETDLDIRAPSTTVTKGYSVAVRHDQPAHFEIPGGFVRGTMKTRITVEGVPAAAYGAALQYLLRYPHGCAEQVASRAFPLLYLGSMAKAAAPDIVPASGVDALVNAAVHRLFGMQTRTGALGYWPGAEHGYPWATVYAAHFLVEARRAGFAVDGANLTRLLDHLTRIARAAALPSYHGQVPSGRAQAYALYVLSLAERPLLGELQHAADGLASQATDAETEALIDGALLLAGDRRRAAEFIGQQLPAVSAAPREGFASPQRADAVMLAVLADVDPTHRSVPELIKRLQGSAKAGRWSNTQENAFAMLALGKIGKRLGGSDFWGTVRVDGVELKKFNNERRGVVIHEGNDWTGKAVDVTVTGLGTAFLGVQVEGIEAGLPEAAWNGLEVTRVFLDRNGDPIDVNAVTHGDMVVAKVTVAAPRARVENVALIDLLPAGFEVDNPRLSDDAVLPWMKDRATPDYLDVRDDRLIYFTSLEPKVTKTFYYYARAVTAGDFVLPHAFAEAMYDPTVNARGGGGRIHITAR